MNIPEKIASELKPLIHHFGEFCYCITETKVGSMDSYYARFTRDNDSFDLTKDRSQWMFGGERAYLEPRGLFRVFNEFPEFYEAAITWFDKEKAGPTRRCS
jgi:hypothetical protein